MLVSLCRCTRGSGLRYIINNTLALLYDSECPVLSEVTLKVNEVVVISTHIIFCGNHSRYALKSKPLGSPFTSGNLSTRPHRTVYLRHTTYYLVWRSMHKRMRSLILMHSLRLRIQTTNCINCRVHLSGLPVFHYRHRKVQLFVTPELGLLAHMFPPSFVDQCSLSCMCDQPNFGDAARHLQFFHK